MTDDAMDIADEKAERKAKRKRRLDWWLGNTPEQQERLRQARLKAGSSTEDAVGDSRFGPFQLDGAVLRAGENEFDLRDSVIEFMTDGKQKRFTGTRVAVGVGAATLVGPLGLLIGAKRKDRKANAIAVVDTAGHSYTYSFKHKDVLAGQTFVMKVQAVQQGLGG